MRWTRMTQPQNFNTVHGECDHETNFTFAQQSKEVRILLR